METRPALTEPLGRRAYKRAIRRLTKRSAIRPLLPVARRSVERIRPLGGATNQHDRYASTSDAADWALARIDDLHAFVDDGPPPQLPPRHDLHRFTGGRPPRASAAIRAVVELCMAATAPRAFDRLVIQAALSLVDSGEPSSAVELALHEACH